MKVLGSHGSYIGARYNPVTSSTMDVQDLPAGPQDTSHNQDDTTFLVGNPY